MKHWEDDKYVELRDTYGGNFSSPITVPAMKGKVLQEVDGGDDILMGLYEFEVMKTPAAVMSRVDPSTGDTVNDECVMFEYRLTHPNGLAGVVNSTTAPIPITELTPELTKILKDHDIIITN